MEPLEHKNTEIADTLAPRSIEEIKRSYPDEWILLGNPVEDEYERTIAGVVLYHSPDKREVCYLGKSRIVGYKRTALFFNRVTPRREKRHVIASLFYPVNI